MATDSRLLLVDDEADLRTVLSMRLEAMGYRVDAVETGADATRAMGERRYEGAICDLRLGAESGLDVMEELHALDPAIPVLILTAHGSIPNAVEAMNRGAAGYLTKPVDKDELGAQLNRCLQTRRLTDEVEVLRRAVEERLELEGIIGGSPGIRRVFELIEKVAPTRITVSVFGESGTGKELVARALHQLSPRANREFLAINCASLPSELLQSELFGHRKGAFTGADEDRTGLFEQADGGTLFLDEIGDLAPNTQVALLRVIQEGEVMPIGAKGPVPVDVRLVVATHRDLRACVADGSFREDLFFRVNVAPIHLPPLRERGEDRELLATVFLEEFAPRHSRPDLEFSADALDAIRDYTWPGNVRELRHAVERAVVMAEGDAITSRDLLPPSVSRGDTPVPGILPFREARDEWERDYLVHLLQHTGGNVSAAARIAGKYRADLYGLFRKHKLDPNDYKRSDGAD